MKIIGWYFSFAGTDKFLGCCQTHGETLQEAFSTVNRLKLNPGGQVVAIPVPEDAPNNPHMWDKLYTSLDEMNAVYGRMIKQGDMDKEEHATLVAYQQIIEEKDNAESV